MFQNSYEQKRERELIVVLNKKIEKKKRDGWRFSITKRDFFSSPSVALKQI